MPVEECKRALRAAPILDEDLYRRCAGEGEGEGEGESGEESGGDGDTEEGGDNDTGSSDDDDGNVDNAQIAPNSTLYFHADGTVFDAKFRPLRVSSRCTANTESCSSRHSSSEFCNSATAAGITSSSSSSSGTATSK